MVRAILIAGGRGTRLLPLTERVPKHLMPVGDAPLIGHLLRRLADHRITRVTLASGHLGDVLATALGDGRAWGVELAHSRELEPLGTGGAVAAAFAATDDDSGEPVLVLNADLISGHDLGRQVRAADGADLCLHVRDVEDPRRYGCVETHGRRVVGFAEKPELPRGRTVNAGTYVFSAAVLRALPATAPLSLERDVIPGLLARGARVTAHREDSYFRDVGTPEDLVAASSDAVLGRIPGIAGHGQRWVSPLAAVGAGAELTGGTAVNAGSTIGAGARLDACLVMPGATVPAGDVRVREILVAPQGGPA